MHWFDAHNHLQDPRLGTNPSGWVSAASAAGVLGMVVNGTCETDWPEVLRLASLHPSVIPAFGLHPWRVSGRTPGWLGSLIECFDRTPGAVLGEIGLDRWILDLPVDRLPQVGSGLLGPAPIEEQLAVFEAQLDLATERALPVTVHCLKAWGALMESLRRRPPLPRGFLLHSYGGPAELVPELVRLGAFFSISGHSLHPRKASHGPLFRSIPRDRLLIETDAPDQIPPAAFISHPATDPRGLPVNSPANLPRIAEGVAVLLEIPIEALAERCEANWHRFFGRPQPVS
jgi:TatD DNase family protein